MVTLRSLAFGATMFSSSALNNLFVTYYITYFTSIVGITPRGFYAAQVVFMYAPIRFPPSRGPARAVRSPFV